jgi:hypothetical protein
VAVALLLRLIHLDWGLPEVYEEATPVREAVEMWGPPGGHLDFHPHFFRYPSLTFYLNFILQAGWYFVLSLTGSVDSLNDFRQLLAQRLDTAVLLGRVLDALLGALIVIPAWRLGRLLAGSAAGWIAGLLAAVLPVAVTESQLAGPDVLLTLCAGWALVAATRIAERGERRDYLWCGVAIGLATGAKYPGAFLVAPLVAAHLARTWREPGTPVLSLSLFEALAVSALAFVAASPYVLLDLPGALRDLGFERHHMAVGHFGREQGRAWSFYLVSALPRGWTPGVAVAAALGGIALLARGRTRRLTIPGAVFVAVVLVVLGSWRMAAARYALPLVPVGAAWAGAFAASVSDRFAGSARPPLVLAALAALLVAWPAAVSVREVGFRGREDSRRAAEAWIAEHVPPGAAILLERYGPEPDPERYLVLHLPFHGVTPHVYDAAYWEPLYVDFDVVVLSSGVSARYRAKPAEYPWQNRFYAALGERFEERALFAAGAYLGPEIRILTRRPGPPLLDVSVIPERFFASLRGNGPLAEYLSALGTLLVRQERTEVGFRLLDEAVAMDPTSAKTWGNLGSMRLRDGDYEGALLAFRRASERDPRDPQVWANLGTLYARMGEPGQAVDAYAQAVAYGPDQEAAYIGLARALIEDDRYERARVVLNTFLDRFPRSSRRGSAEQALEELKFLGPGKPG